MSYVSTVPDPDSAYDPDPDEQARRSEFGWTEVRRGLGLILRGWLLMLVSLGLAVGVLVLIFWPGENGRPTISAKWRDLSVLFTILGLGVAWLYCYGCIVVGHWRCLMFAPERNGAKWLMFGCMICICAGPVLNTTMGFGGLKKPPKIKRGLEDLREVEFTPTAVVAHTAAAVVDVLSFVLFILFLRSVAGCFNDGTRVLFADLYLLLYGMTLGGTLFLMFGNPAPAMQLPFALGALGGGVTCFFGYLFLVCMARGGITRGLARVQSPFEA